MYNSADGIEETFANMYQNAGKPLKFLLLRKGYNQ